MSSVEQKKRNRGKYHVVIVDNYDSFTYNLVQAFGNLGAKVSTVLNDQLEIEDIFQMSPTHLCVSPGPGMPENAGLSNELILKNPQRIPLLGVCLGHQCIVEAFGGKVVRASRILHGKTSMIIHNGQFPFENVSNPFMAMRYHSLIAQEETLPDCIQPLAWTEEKELMAIRHCALPLWGIQFHPESVLTPEGNKILEAFLDRSEMSLHEAK